MISSNKPPREGKDQAGLALKRHLAPMLWLAMGVPVALMGCAQAQAPAPDAAPPPADARLSMDAKSLLIQEIGRASCRERV